MFSLIWDKITNFFYDLTYYIGRFFLRILKILYEIFQVFAGTKEVTYHDSEDYLINIFFGNSTINTLYAGMALIGIAILFVATIVAVTKKSVDVDDKMQTDMGAIIRKLLSSFILILSMNAIMMVTINFSNTLMQSVEYLFDNAQNIGKSSVIYFNDKQYAIMARIFNTIGNYSLSESYNSRFNINSCYNDIRGDMQSLQNANSVDLFSFSYPDKINGTSLESWQSILARIARARDLTQDMPLDEYDAPLADAILDAMEFAKKNKNKMSVLQSYSEPSTTVGTSKASIDVIMFLSATTDAAKNGHYNGGAVSFADPIRGQYLTGQRDIYDIDDVKSDFTLAFGRFNHLVVIIGAIILCKEFFALAINCVARIFNMLLLYLVAPPFIALSPLDDGAKFKQWKTAFVIQCFNVFGSVISIRLLLLLFPIIFDSQMVLLGSGFTEILAKVLLLIGAVYTARNANGLFSGILAENAGYQSIMAGDAASAVRKSGFGKAYDGMMGLAESAGAGLLKGGANIAKSAIKAPVSVAKSIASAIKGNGEGDSGDENDGSQSTDNNQISENDVNSDNSPQNKSGLGESNNPADTEGNDGQGEDGQGQDGQSGSDGVSAQDPQNQSYLANQGEGGSQGEGRNQGDEETNNLIDNGGDEEPQNLNEMNEGAQGQAGQNGEDVQGQAGQNGEDVQGQAGQNGAGVKGEDGQNEVNAQNPQNKAVLNESNNQAGSQGEKGASNQREGSKGPSISQGSSASKAQSGSQGSSASKGSSVSQSSGASKAQSGSQGQANQQGKDGLQNKGNSSSVVRSSSVGQKIANFFKNVGGSSGSDQLDDQMKKDIGKKDIEMMEMAEIKEKKSDFNSDNQPSAKKSPVNMNELNDGIS